MKGHKLIPLLVVAAGVLVYSNSLTGPFIFDDGPSIQGNLTIRQLWPLSQPLSPPHRGGITVEGRPLINLSLAINYALSGLNVWSYHAFNLSIHILAGLTLFGVVRRTLAWMGGTAANAEVGTSDSAALPTAEVGTRSTASMAAPERSPTGDGRAGAQPYQQLAATQRGPTNSWPRWSAALPVAAAAAILWTVHPLATESVTYVVQRAESIMGLFYLLTLYCFIRGATDVALVGTRYPASVAAQQRGPTNGWPRGSAALPSSFWFTLSVVACLLGMASKEVMASAPLMVFLYDRTFVSGSLREAWARRKPLYLGLASTWILLGYLLIYGGSIDNAVANAKAGGLDRWGYLLTEPGVILHYLQLTAWPHPLCLDYFGWSTAGSWLTILPSALAVAILLGATAWACKANPATSPARSAWGFLGAWFFLILAPSSSFIPLDSPAFEHRMYLSLAAVIVAGVIGIQALAGRYRVAVVAVLAIGLGILTWQRNLDYRSEYNIWQDTAIKRPDNPRAHSSLGVALARLGKPQEAVAQFEESLRLKPDYADAHNNLGVAMGKAGRVPEAIAHCEEALRLKPDFAEAHYSLGVVLEQAGRTQEAVEHYVRALRIKPEYADAHNNLGVALLRAGRVPEAMTQFQQALWIKPDYAEAHNNFGTALLQAGRMQDAIRQWEQALRLKPDYAEAQNNWGLAMEQLGNLPEAIAHYEQAVRINPNYAKGHFNLGVALEKSGRIQEAIAQYEQSLRIQPSMAAAQKAIARLNGGF